ncbi:MAG: hypothetical protein IJO26_01720 [Clostridium sp.]|nr:hypothetical protein [Clostridium sp.]
MNDLNDLLGLNLNKISIYEINEENLITLKSCDFYVKNNFYFWLINKINTLENKNILKELSYAHYLMSYYIFIILTPLSYEEISFYHIKKALEYDDILKYKEWILIFSTLPNPLLKPSDAVTLAKEIIKENKDSNLANTILQIF